MSQYSENDSDDDDCEYFLQPVSNQYNISDKIKEANQQLYKNEHTQRSQPKVRFRDHQLVDYEPGDEIGMEIMERRRSSSSTKSFKKTDDESSDDGYIDDELLETSTDERLIIETIEIEEVCEEIEILEISDSNNRPYTNDINESLDSEEAIYEKDEFYKDEDARDACKSTDKIKSEAREKSSSSKRIFRTKINPIGNVPIDERRTRTKKCCEYKETDEYKQKLPKYNGFYSHYGFSKDEIERREQKMLTNVELKRRRSSQYIEKQEYVAKTNEEAFAKWLKKKMRNTVNRSNPINMYDMKPTFTKKRQSYKVPQRKQRYMIQRQMETEEQDFEEYDEVNDEENYEDNCEQQELGEQDESEAENNGITVPDPSDEYENEEEQEEENELCEM